MSNFELDWTHVPECRVEAFPIKMYYDDHNPPHFHAEYAGEEALIPIDTLDVTAGDLPSRALGLVYGWAGKHRAELREAWKRRCGRLTGSLVQLRLPTITDKFQVVFDISKPKRLIVEKHSSLLRGG